MNNQNLIICDFQALFDILSEIQEDLNFKLINTTQKNYINLNLNKSDNYLSISKKKNSKFDKLYSCRRLSTSSP